MHSVRLLFAFVVAFAASPALAFNALGHKVIADIAWQQLDEKTRAEIVAVLRRHPRFDQDFAPGMPDADQDRWIFQHAATWPDQIRGNRDFDHPTWHYVDFPLFVGPERPVTFNRGTEPTGDRTNWNVMQAIAYNRGVLAGDAPPQDKAIAYCWIFHLVGDLHQPLHSTALVCDKLPEGDRGGNDIRTVQGRNLHALWDGLLGRRDRPNDVRREVAELQAHAEWWKVDATIDVPAWIAESHELCKSVVYSPEILTAVQQPGELTTIRLPEVYLNTAGDKARQRVVAAGLRLAALLSALADGTSTASLSTGRLGLPGQTFEFDGHAAFIMTPSEERQSSRQPWIFYAPTLPPYPDEHEKWMHEKFLDAGVAVAGVDVGESYGSPAGRKVFDAFYKEIVERRGYAPRPCLLARSRGGLGMASWAADHPDWVAGLAGIYPAFDLRTYPGLANAAPAYGLDAAALAQSLKTHNPIERVAALAQARIPALLIHGDQDDKVPLAPNSARFAEIYEAEGAASAVKVIVCAGRRHDFWTGYFQSQELVDFAIERARAGAGHLERK